MLRVGPKRRGDDDVFDYRYPRAGDARSPRGALRQSADDLQAPWALVFVVDYCKWIDLFEHVGCLTEEFATESGCAAARIPVWAILESRRRTR